MDGHFVVVVIIPLILVSMVVEYWAGRIFFRRKLYRFNSVITDFSIGFTNLVSGLFLAAIKLSVYLYILNHWSVFDWDRLDWRLWVFALVSYDLLYYCCHYCHHKINFLWANHIVHHSGEEFNYALAIRISFLGGLTVWPFFLPMAFLGIPLEIYAAVALLQIVYQFSIHTTLIPDLGWLEKILVTPSQHRVHHAKNPEYVDKNLGCFSVVWDRLFGTYQRELGTVKAVYGVSQPVNTVFPEMLNFSIYYQIFLSLIHSKGWKDLGRELFGAPSNQVQKRSLLEVLKIKNNQTESARCYLPVPKLYIFFSSRTDSEP